MPHWPPTPPRWAPPPRPETSDDRSVTFARHRAGPFNIALRAYRSDFAQPEHEHPAAIIDLNLAGGGVGRCGVDQRESRPGELEAFAPGTPHCFRSGPVGIRTMHVSIAEHDLGAAQDGGVCALSASPHFNRAEALRHALALLQMARTPGAWDQQAAEAEAWGLFGVVFTRPTHRAHANAAEPPAWLRRALDLLHATTDRGVPIAELASACTVHRGTLMRAFAQHLGTTPGAYHRALRTAHAAGELARGRAPAAAALDCGFADQPHLTRLFSRSLGLTPRAFVGAVGACATAGRVHPRG